MDERNTLEILTINFTKLKKELDIRRIEDNSLIPSLEQLGEQTEQIINKFRNTGKIFRTFSLWETCNKRQEQIVDIFREFYLGKELSDNLIFEKIKNKIITTSEYLEKNKIDF